MSSLKNPPLNVNIPLSSTSPVGFFFLLLLQTMSFWPLCLPLLLCPLLAGEGEAPVSFFFYDSTVAFHLLSPHQNKAKPPPSPPKKKKKILVLTFLKPGAVLWNCWCDDCCQRMWCFQANPCVRGTGFVKEGPVTVDSKHPPRT